MTTNEVELDPSVVEAFARELARVCPGSPGAMLTVYAPEPGGPPWQVEIIFVRARERSHSGTPKV